MSEIVKVVNGNTVKESKDCWGGQSFFVYDEEGKQLFDGEDTLSGALEQLNNYLGK